MTDEITALLDANWTYTVGPSERTGFKYAARVVSQYFSGRALRLSKGEPTREVVTGYGATHKEAAAALASKLRSKTFAIEPA